MSARVATPTVMAHSIVSSITDASDRPTVHVVLVEDNPSYAKLAGLYLEQIDDFAVKPIVARSLAEARSLAASDVHVDLVLQDVNLTDSIGEDTITAATEMWGDIPVVAISGSLDEAMIRTVTSQGGAGFLHKEDVRPTSLARCIHMALARRARLESWAATRDAKLHAITTSLAHDVRTPLVTIDFQVESLLDELDQNGRIDPAVLRQHLETIREQTALADDLVRSTCESTATPGRPVRLAARSQDGSPPRFIRPLP